jgi:putative transposase
MKKQRHSEEQIIAVLKEAQAGAKVDDVCRRHGISQPTYYKWKQRFGGLEVSDAKRLRLLEEENRKLKKLVADQALDAMVLKEIIAKKF